MKRQDDRPSDVPRFRLLRVLGQGAHGIVYDAEDADRGQRVALKRLKYLTPAAVYRFKQEFRAVAALRHTNLVRELLCIQGDWYLTMDVVDGEDFIAYVRGYSLLAGQSTTEKPAPGGRPDTPADSSPKGCLDAGRLRAALRQLCAGVLAIHAAGRLHRDLKPSNIRITDEGRVIILDFGLAVTWESEDAGRTFEKTGDVLGTPIYMSPEQAAGARLTQASDWYSVGVILFQALTGRSPFEGDVYDVLRGKRLVDPPDPRSQASDLPEDLCELCLGLLRRDPGTRPRGEEIARFLDADAVRARGHPARETVLVGRERELALLEAALERSRLGACTAVHLRGASGMGKSTLATHFLDNVRARNRALVLRGRCFERESVPYRAVDAFIDALVKHLLTLPEASVRRLVPREAGALVKLFPVLEAVDAFALALPMSTGDPHTLRRQGFGALRELLRRLAAEQPVAIHLDDLQWGDQDSAELLAHAIRPPDAPAVLLIVSYRAEDEVSSPVVEALRETGDMVDLDLPPLGAPAVGLLARRLLGERGIVDDELVGWITGESEGNPFFAQELARHAAADADRPTSLGAFLAQRVGALPAAARRLLEVIAIADRPLPAGVAARAARLDADAEETAQSLREAQLTRTRGSVSAQEVEMFHDRVRDAVVALMSEDDRRHRHLELAQALVAAGVDDAAALAKHWRGAGDTARAAEQSERAARRASEALAFEQAASSLRQALELAPAAEHGRLRTLLGQALADAGKSREAASAFLAAIHGASADEALALRRRAAEQLLRGGHLRDGADVIRDALLSVGLSYPSTPRTALAAMLWHRARVQVRGLDFAARSEGEISAGQLARIDLCWAAAQGFGYTDVVRGMDFQAQHLLLALQAGDPDRIVRGLAVEAMHVAASGDLRRAGSLVERAAALLERVARSESRLWVELGAGATAVCAYRWRDALSSLVNVPKLAAGHEAAVRWALGGAMYFTLQALIYSGDVTAVAERVPRIIAEARDRGDLHTEVTIGTYPLPWYLVAHDAPDDALRELDHIIGRWTPPGFHLQHFGELLAHAEILLYRGDAQAALSWLRSRWQALQRSQMLRGRFVADRAHELLARTLVACASGPGDPLLRQAERLARRLLRPDAAPWVRSLATLIRGLIAYRRGDHARCVARLEEAEVGLAAADGAVYSASVRRQRGLLLGGAEGRTLVTTADEILTRHGVRSPERYGALIAPLGPKTGPRVHYSRRHRRSVL